MRPLSARNPRIQRLNRLVRRRRDRVEQRAFVVEGPVLASTALDAGWVPTDVFVDEGRLGEASVAALIERTVAAGSSVWSLETGVLDRIGDAVTSQGVLAVVDRPDQHLPRAESNGFVLALVGVADPGNCGTLIRAAVASGAGAVVVTGGVDPTNPKVVRSSAGAVFSVPVVEFDDEATAVGELGRAGYRLLGTVVRDGISHVAADVRRPVAVLVGNEATGLAAETVDRLDESVTIDMVGPTESLNVAMAGTLMAFEVMRRSGEI